jgi:valyl-tRNA synthetase
VRQEAGLDPSARVKVSLAGQTAAVRDLVTQIGELTHSEVSLGAGGDGAATVVRAIEIRLVAERDQAEDVARLARDVEEARQLVQRSRDLLAKPGFADKAPQEVVEKERAKLKEREDRLKLLEAELKKR